MASVKPYRQCAGSVIFNAAGKILAGERYAAGPQPSGTWQFPQGGVDEGESVVEAAARETEEEVGIPRTALQLVYSVPEPMCYEFPLEYSSPITRKFRGQAMHWTLFYWNGRTEDCRLDHCEEGRHPEFSQVAWVDWPFAIEEVSPMKRPIYAKLFTILHPIIDKHVQEIALGKSAQPP